MTFITKDSGERQTFSTGMQRDSAQKDLRPDLVYTRMLIRWSGEDARLSAMEHFVAWFEGKGAEDHAAICLAWIGASERARGNILVRWAELMGRGAQKYGERNWEKARTEEELARFRASAFRHFVQWFYGLNPEEDHAAAVFFNIAGAEFVKARMAEEAKATLVPATSEPKPRFEIGARVRIQTEFFDGVEGMIVRYDSNDDELPWRVELAEGDLYWFGDSELTAPTEALPSHASGAV